jgi:hypothetical protein
MKKYTVIVLRTPWFMDCVHGFDSPQDLQYVATGVEAPDLRSAGVAARKEALHGDYECLHSATGYDLHNAKWEDYSVLGTITGSGKYTPWLNGDRP